MHSEDMQRVTKSNQLRQKDRLEEQLEASKSSIKDLFSDLFNETKNLKYPVTLKVTPKNASRTEKLNLFQFISIQLQKQ